jgi:hypothetical protein
MHIAPTHSGSEEGSKSEGRTITETAKTEVVAKDPVPVHLVPEPSRTSDSIKPPKLESKCNCAIM